MLFEFLVSFTEYIVLFWLEATCDRSEIFLSFVCNVYFYITAGPRPLGEVFSIYSWTCFVAEPLVIRCAKLLIRRSSGSHGSELVF